MFDSLVRKYEAAGDPGCVSTGSGDLGGVSYGIYQFAANTGSAQEFAEWATENENKVYAEYGERLAMYNAGSSEFSHEWQSIGEEDPEGFAELQGQFAKMRFYDPAVNLLREAGYDPDNKSTAMKSVVFSRCIQYGAGNMVELFEEAVHSMYNCDYNDFRGWPNLTYVDDPQFDYDLIAAIYDFLIKEADEVSFNGRYYHSPKDWVNGSNDVVYGLRNRFVHEKEDALNILLDSSNN